MNKTTWSQRFLCITGAKELTLLSVISVSLAGCTDVTIANLPVEIEVNPPELSFENTRVLESRSLDFTIFETGGHTPALIRSMALTGAGAENFSLSIDGAFEIEAGGEMAVTVTFAPQAIGIYEPAIHFVAQDGGDSLGPIQLFGQGIEADADGDGYGENEGDCDDGNADQNPDGIEICNQKDDDCDGQIDEQAIDPQVFYVDGDGDGFGNAEISACFIEAGWVETAGDCDDEQAEIHPEADEVCDDLDNDCNDLIDDEPVDASLFFVDADGDGFGQDSEVIKACALPEGHSTLNTDCDDSQVSIYPGAPEHCNLLDDDCNGLIDDEAVDMIAYYPDLDGDGVGDSQGAYFACSADDVQVAGDCDDQNALIFPGQDERCDGVDQDCDLNIDEGAIDGTLYFNDADHDGFGMGEGAYHCAAPDDSSLVGGDCDDANGAIHPQADEICNGLDDDCNAQVDDGIDGTPNWYFDGDDDGYGDNAKMVSACFAPPGYGLEGGDCDDAQGAIHPGASERCDEKDEDCDGAVDEEAVDAQSVYIDADGDGHGLEGSLHLSCEALPTAAGDCNDNNAGIYPGADERCDAQDQDCDGLIDEAPSDGYTFFIDGDGDGFGSAPTLSPSCTAPEGTTVVDGDCNDANAAIYPGATEVCNGLDDDCDETIDQNAEDASPFYADGDGDGFGSAESRLACAAPDGFVANPGDCDDEAAAIYPGADEYCNGLDDDCDSQSDEAAVDATAFHRDGDGDGFGLDDETQSRCEASVGWVQNAGDCDDDIASIHPGADEKCDGDDEDCDGAVDEEAMDETAFALDGDGDGFGHGSASVYGCTLPANGALNREDCDDGNAEIHPDAHEICNGLDDDCNALVDDNPQDAPDFYADGDGDGYGTAGAIAACTAPDGHVEATGDCDDSDGAIYPGADEYCDEVDSDCDGTIDEGAVDAVVWAPDADGDGHGDGTQTVVSCTAPDGTVEVPDETGPDCDDDDPTTHPGATESCDGVDHNCDGAWSPATCEGCHVDDDDPNALYQSIQMALEDASRGLDFGGRLGICEGVYTEKLDFTGAPVILEAVGEGEVILAGGVCASSDAYCSVVRFSDGEGPESGLKGVIIEDGQGTKRRMVSGQSGDTRVGGAILIDGAAPTLTDLVIRENQAADGAAIAVFNGNPTVVDVVIEAHHGERGGAYYVSGGALSLNGGTVTDMHVNHQGAVLYADDGADIYLDGLHLADNIGAGYGGVLYIEDAFLRVENTVFIDNATHSSAGGAIHQHGGELTVLNSDFIGNAVAGGGENDGGGALYLEDLTSALIEGNLFDANTSNGYGAAISVMGGSDIRIAECIFDGNLAATHGGAVHMIESDALAIQNVQFLANEGRYGGALHLKGGSAEIWHGYFEGNSSREFGGAAFFGDGDLHFFNNILVQNSSDRFGGGLYFSGFEGQVLNNTLHDNHSADKGSGIYVQTADAQAQVQNNVVTGGNQVGVFAPSQFSSSYQYNNTHGNSGGNTNGFSQASSNLNTDPRYMDVDGSDPSAWDLSLNVWSPCLDAGNPAESHDDQDGSRNDMGVYGGPHGMP